MAVFNPKELDDFKGELSIEKEENSSSIKVYYQASPERLKQAEELFGKKLDNLHSQKKLLLFINRESKFLIIYPIVTVLRYQ